MLNNDISDLRRINRKKVFESIYYAKKELSKKDISKELGISLPTVNQNVAELTKVGLVKEEKSEKFTGGRYAKVIKLKKNALYCIGISLSDSTLKFLLTDILQNEVGYKKIKYKLNSFLDEIGSLISDELEIFLDENKIDRKKVLGVGVGIPGVIDEVKKEIVFAPTLRLKNTPISKITGQIKYKWYAENDATAAGINEFYLSKNVKNMAYISLENGVGGCIIIDSNVYLGDNKMAGEFGHMTVENGGLDCACGKKGCLEAYINAGRFSDNMGIELNEFFSEMENGNEEYKKIWKETLKHLCVAVNNIHTSFDCSVVLGGFMAVYLEKYLDEIIAYLSENSASSEDTKFLWISPYGGKSVCFGLSYKIINKFLEEI